jgi:hypothetical protein
MPITVTASKAKNFRNMKTSALLVPSFVDTQLSSVTSTSPTKATPLFNHVLASTASAPITARTRYSPKIIAIMAAEPGFSTTTAHHVKRKPAHSPKIFDR